VTAVALNSAGGQAYRSVPVSRSCPAGRATAGDEPSRAWPGSRRQGR
jgi:hypothetical protein